MVWKGKIMGKNLIRSGVLLALAFLAGGCTIALVGAGAAGSVAYLRGDLEAMMAQDVDTVYQASLKALEQLEITPTKKDKDALSATIIARGADDKKITIKLKRTEQDLTKLSVRIGILGNETQSQVIYEQIKKNLPSTN